jgi:hypothetical protein
MQLSSRFRNFIHAFKQDARERFMKFETFNGAFIYIPWGWGFFYYGWPWSAKPETFWYIVAQPQFGYNYALITTGIVLMIWGLRKTFVNRVKQQAQLEAAVEQRKVS